MTYAVMIARILLSVVFAVAGTAKLADRAGSRAALTAFGVPNPLTRPLTILLPLAELATAALLLPVASAWLGGIAALFLLLAFLVGISINLARGRTPNCHCFGQLHSSPVGWSTLLRNVALCLGAGLVVCKGRSDPGPSVLARIAHLTVAQGAGLLAGLAVLALLAVEAALLLQVLRQQGRILLRLEGIESRPNQSIASPASSSAPSAGLPIGAPAPSFRLPDLSEEIITLEGLVAAGKPLLLLFTNPNCGPCEALLPDIGRWQHEHIAALNVVVVSEGTAKDNRSKSAAYGVRQVLLQQRREVAESYQAWGTPSAVLIHPDRTVASGLAQGSESIKALLTQSLVGPPAPILGASHGVQARGRNGNGSGSRAIPVAPQAG